MAKQTFTTGQVLTASQMTSLQETALGGGPATAKTANYVLVASDAGTTVAMNAAGATTITVNTGLFAAGDTVFIQNLGAGACTITAGTATVATAGSLILPQNDAGILYFTSASASIFYDYVQPGITSPVTTKGDLYSFTTTDARLPVGNDGESIVADSSTATGLSYAENYAAGKNKIINGDFGINQRNFVSSTVSAEFNLDRWRTIYTGGTSTTSVQTFTPGAAPVAGVESKNFYRVAITGQSTTSDFVRMQEQVEGVRTFAGQTTTYSFYAKASAGAPKVAVISVQSFGGGGSPSAAVTTEHGTITLSTSFQRFSVVCAIPSISGKTLGTAGDDSVSVRLLMSAGTGVTGNQSIGVQNFTFETWGHQWEAGSVATAFQTATGTLAGELAACQRHFTRIGGEVAFNFLANAYFDSTTTGFGMVNYSSMRTTPAATFTTASNYAALNVGTAVTACTAIAADFLNTKSFRLNFTVGSARTAGQGLIMTSNNTTNGFIDISAEL